MATSPITEEREGQKYVVGTDIPIWSTKIGSTESHNNEFIMREDLFSPEQVRYLAGRRPFVVVVDASTSISDPQRTSPHIPDGFKGYRNYFMALDTALGISYRPSDFGVDEQFVNTLKETGAYKKVVASNHESSHHGEGYQWHIYYPGEKTLYLRTGKKVAEPAMKLKDEDLTGPSVIFVQASIEPEAVPAKIRDEFIKGRHTPAYFDDKDHYKEFYFDYEEGYGIRLSRSYTVRWQVLYRELVAYLGENAPRLQHQRLPSLELTEK